MKRRGSSRWGAFPWRGEPTTLEADGRACRVCGKPIGRGDAVLYHPFAVGGTESHIGCGFRTREECKAAGVPYRGPKEDK